MGKENVLMTATCSLQGRFICQDSMIVYELRCPCHLNETNVVHVNQQSKSRTRHNVLPARKLSPLLWVKKKKNMFCVFERVRE